MFLLSYLSFLAFDVASRSRGKPPFSFSFSFFFFSPIFPVFSFFCEIHGERQCKKRVFSSSEFLRTFYEVYGCIRALFSSSLSRAVPSQCARVRRGQGSDDVSRSRAKLVFCLGNQILNFHTLCVFIFETFFFFFTRTSSKIFFLRCKAKTFKKTLVIVIFHKNNGLRFHSLCTACTAGYAFRQCYQKFKKINLS